MVLAAVLSDMHGVVHRSKPARVSQYSAGGTGIPGVPSTLRMLAPLLLGALVAPGAAHVDAAESELYWVHGDALSVGIDRTTGVLLQINATITGYARHVVGRSFVTDAPGGAMDQQSVVIDHQPLQNTVTVTRTCRVQGYGTSAMQDFEVVIVDSFSPSLAGGVAWTLIATSTTDTPWRAAVGTDVKIVDAAGGSSNHDDFWLPQNGASMSEDVLAMRSSGSNSSYEAVELGLNYVAEGQQAQHHMPYPLFMWAAPTGDTADPADGGGGLIVAASLNDTTIAATADLNANRLLYTRLYNRQSSASSNLAHNSWTTHLGALAAPDPAAVDPTLPVVVRQDDPWRDALRFAMAVSPEVFNAVQPAATPSGQPTSLVNVGLGIYTCAPAGSLNISTTVNYAGATTLWDASFWWPYIGLFLPPVPNASTPWGTNVGSGEQLACSKPGGVQFKHGQQASASTVAGHLSEMVESSITNPLSYFNLFEFGQNVKWPLPPPIPGCSITAADAAAAAPGILPARCWNDSSTMLASTELGHAIMFASAADKKPTYSWQNAVVLDPGVPAYKAFLVEQAARHFTLLGNSFHGIVIDRTDWTSHYGRNRDDGTTWCGAPCASMLPAWLEASEAVSDVVHGITHQQPPRPPGSEPLMLINFAGSARIELLTHADGVFSEDGDTLLNSIALSTVAMPAIGWTYQGKRAASALDDAYMQHHLRMGVAPMAPAFASDHSLADGDDEVNALFKDYGALFTMLRGVRWGVDRSHVISVEPPPGPKGGPKHNVFQAMDPQAAQVPWTIVLALADPSVDSVLVTLKLPFGNQPAGCEVQLPGVDEANGGVRGMEPAVVVSRKQVGQTVLLQLQARLLRGCAILQCSLE
jgi:hypothetical protein